MKRSLALLLEHQADLSSCRRCPGMVGPVVMGSPVLSDVLLIGQAPGDREGKLGRPFAWTAGKTMFGWFAQLGVDEPTFRSRVYMAAVCRCFPGKLARGGDRVPSRDEVAACRPWLEREINLLRPKLVVPVGRLAIELFLPPRPLVEQIGRRIRHAAGGQTFDLVPLPHPSGASTWFRMSPGRELLAQALGRLAVHPAWRALRP